jgi:hypothetical protein
VLPLCLSILLCISGALWLILGRGREEERSGIDLRRLIRKGATPSRIVLLTAAFILALNPLGYLAASTLYLFSVFLWVSRYRLWAAIGLAVILGGKSWYFFGKILAVQLPRGIWAL